MFYEGRRRGISENGDVNNSRRLSGVNGREKTTGKPFSPLFYENSCGSCEWLAYKRSYLR